MMIATAALLLAVDLVATTSHHRPRSPPPGQSEIVVWKKVCPMVTAARAAGMTDDQIIAVAVAQDPTTCRSTINQDRRSECHRPIDSRTLM